MRKLPEFVFIHLSPPSTTLVEAPPPYPPTKCDAQKCPWWPYTNSKEFKTNTALILVVLFGLLICGLALNSAVRYFIRMHCRQRQSENAADQKSEVEEVEIPSIVYSEEDQLKNLKGAESECIICLSEFAIGDRIRVLDKCNHGFHVSCIQKWLVSHSSCPTCRTNYTVQSDAVAAP